MGWKYQTALLLGQCASGEAFVTEYINRAKYEGLTYDTKLQSISLACHPESDKLPLSVSINSGSPSWLATAHWVITIC